MRATDVLLIFRARHSSGAQDDSDIRVIYISDSVDLSSPRLRYSINPRGPAVFLPSHSAAAMAKTRIAAYLRPSAWALEPEPSTFAPSSRWSNKDMDPVPPREVSSLSGSSSGGQ